MNVTHAIWFFAGVGLGIAHATSLWHSAQSPNVLTALTGVLRLVLMGVGLAVAAVFGGIIPTAAGWGAAFFVAVVTTYLYGKERRSECLPNECSSADVVTAATQAGSEERSYVSAGGSKLQKNGVTS